jgi:cephalosporin-C deacetylase
MLVDWPLEQLRAYRPPRREADDYEEFWRTTLRRARDRAGTPIFERYDAGLTLMTVDDVMFTGFDGQPVRAWLYLPRDTAEPLPCIVEYTGYSGGRGLAHESLMWSAAGYAHFVMDTRGQGSGWRVGHTPDPDPDGGPSTGGFVTRGILHPDTYYYRRLFTDAVRAVDTVREHALVDADRIVVAGHSQGGAVALAAAGLADGIAGAIPDQPFLCHVRRATEITDGLYGDFVAFCRAHPDHAERVFDTLDYFDAVNFAARAQAPALFSAGLMDAVCPPSTIFAAYNHYAGPKDIRVWPHHGHDGPAGFRQVEHLRFVRELMT